MKHAGSDLKHNGHGKDRQTTALLPAEGGRASGLDDCGFRCAPRAGCQLSHYYLDWKDSDGSLYSGVQRVGMSLCGESLLGRAAWQPANQVGLA
jgi:hypothetical protein